MHSAAGHPPQATATSVAIGCQTEGPG